MTHLVFGTGLIGGFIAGGLIKAGLDTTLLGRDKQRKALQEGFMLTDLSGHHTKLPPPVFWRHDTQEKYEIIWLTVKCTAVPGCVEQLKQLLSPNAIIICCQNGFGSERVIQEAFPDHTILNAVVGFNVAEQADAHLHRSTEGALVVESNPKTAPVLDRLNCGLLPCHAAADIRSERWAKLQLNLANPVNALADLPTKTMVENAAYRKVIVALMRELLAVTKAMNLKLPKLTALPATLLPSIMSLPNWAYLVLAQKTLAIDPSARASMWWDLSQGKQSEIDYLNQAVVDQGQKLGISCPYNQRIVQLVKRVEAGERTIGIGAAELQAEIGLT